jgi:hypothetical protein
MKRILFVLLIMTGFELSAWAQESPIAITYTVSGMSSDGTTITMSLSVTVVNNGPDAVNQVSLLIPGPAGDDTAIQGGITFDSVAAGQSRSAGGEFLAPQQFFEGSPFDVLSWKVSYLDAQGQTRTVMILGHRQP